MDLKSFLKNQIDKGNIDWESRSELLRASKTKISGHSKRILKESSFLSISGANSCSDISFDANEAPWIPSLPVLDPTIKTGFPTPDEVAEIIFPFFIMPAEKAFTKGFVL